MCHPPFRFGHSCPGLGVDFWIGTSTEPRFAQALSELLPPLAQALVGQAVGAQK